MVALTAFLGTMKALGIFAVGTFPWYTEIASSIFMLIYGISLTLKIRKLEAERERDDKLA